MIPVLQRFGIVDLEVEVFVGPMWSGKSEHLLGRYNQCSPESRRFYRVTTRQLSHVYEGECWTHSGIPYSAIFIQYLNQVNPVENLFVDEVMFTCISEIEILFERIAMFRKQRQVCKYLGLGSLDMNWQRHEFPVISYLKEQGFNVLTLFAECVECGSPAPFSAKVFGKAGLNYCHEEWAEDSGQPSPYKPVCPKCYEIVMGLG